MDKQFARGKQARRNVVGVAIGLHGAAEESLLAGVQRGDVESFNRLFLSHYPVVYGLLYRLVGDEADDLAQETFWRLYRRPPRAADSTVRAWLCRVALNLGHNALRGAGRRETYEVRYQAALPAGTESTLPEAAAQAADERRQVRAALARLKRRDAGLLVLRYGGASYREIAETLGVAPTSVGTMLRRAEAAFARAYRAIVGDGERSVPE